MRYTDIIWDFDGTLFDSYPVMAAAWAQALSERGIHEPAAQIEALMKVSMGHCERHYRALHGLDARFIERYRAIRAETEPDGVHPFPGIPALCRAIRGAGGRNYLFTHRGPSAVTFLEKYGMESDFTECITSARNFPRKPSPAAILYLIEAHHIDPAKALMVGDRDLDIESARNAGIDGCYYAGGAAPLDIAAGNIHSFDALYGVVGLIRARAADGIDLL